MVAMPLVLATTDLLLSAFENTVGGFVGQFVSQLVSLRAEISAE